jgi:hypothetical protein
MTKKKYVPEGNTKSESVWMWTMIAIGAVAIPWMLIKSNKDAQKKNEAKLALEALKNGGKI